MLVLLVVALSFAAGILVGRRHRRGREHLHTTAVEPVRFASAASTPITVSEMTATLAHRFDEVLTAILASIELVIQRLDDGPARESARSVEAAALEGTSLVAHLQQFVHHRRMRTSKAVRVDALVREVVADMRPTFPRGIVLHLDVQPVSVMEADAAGLKEAIHNIVENAAQSLGTTGRLTISVRTVRREIVLTIADTGIGMGEEVRKRACEPFFTTKPGSTGLGLTVAYGVALRHGGQVEIESVRSEGTTVRLRLPLERAKPVVPAVRPVSGVAPIRKASAPRRSANCLLVDDDDDVRETLRDILIEGGHRVALARDGDEALDLFASVAFDLVITDFAMPKVNGLLLAERCKRMRPSVPVLLLTGCGEAVAAAARPRDAIDAVLSKPVRVGDLLNAVAAYHPDPGPGHKAA